MWAGADTAPRSSQAWPGRDLEKAASELEETEDRRGQKRSHISWCRSHQPGVRPLNKYVRITAVLLVHNRMPLAGTSWPVVQTDLFFCRQCRASAGLPPFFVGASLVWWWSHAP